MLSSKIIDLLMGFSAGVYQSGAQNPIPPLPTVQYSSIRVLYVYTQYTYSRSLTQREVQCPLLGQPERRLEVQQFTKLVRKYQYDCL